jgi:hypothetical protein
MKHLQAGWNPCAVFAKNSPSQRRAINVCSPGQHMNTPFMESQFEQLTSDSWMGYCQSHNAVRAVSSGFPADNGNIGNGERAGSEGCSFKRAASLLKTIVCLRIIKLLRIRQHRGNQDL